MGDSMAGYELSGEAGAISASGLDRATIEVILEAEAGKAGDVNAPPGELAAALARLARSKQEAGQFAEAEPLFVKALAISENELGPDHPDLVLLLNDLALVYLKQSQYGAAEPLLLRLLDIKRRKGENHPEVATVLGSLAVTQRALGRHESAEALLRRVLEIRERTLAPNHFLVASALEQLAETCEARGKLSEALQLFQRAYTVREVTLGSEHPSIRACRERIADLRLQSSEGSMALVLASAPVSTQYRYPLIGVERPDSPSTGPAPGESQAFTPLRRSRPFLERDPSPVWSAPLNGAESFERAPGNTRGQPFESHTPYRDVLLGIDDDQEETSDRETLGQRISGSFAAIIRFLERRQAAAVALVVVIALAVVGLTVLRTPRDEDVAAATDSGSPQAIAAVAEPIILTNGLRPAATPVPQVISSTLNAKPASTVEPPRARNVQERASTRADATRKAEPKSISIPNISSAGLASLDSLVSRATNAGARTVQEPLPTPAPPVFVSTRPSFGDTGGAGAPQRARLIGELPTPRIPDQFFGIQGEVRVQFRVDPAGQPVMSTFAVISSPNPMLTAAVRNVVPAMRFEPARSGGADPKPIADIVQIWFQFASKAQ